MTILLRKAMRKLGPLLLGTAMATTGLCSTVPLDSLQRELAAHVAGDTARTTLLLATALAAKDIDHTLTYQYAAEARELATRLNEPRKLSQALMLIAQERATHGNDPYATLALWTRAKEVAESIPDENLLCESLIGASSSYFSLQMDSVAENTLGRALDMAGLLKNDVLRSKALYVFSGLRAFQGRHSEAIQMARTGIALERRLNNDPDMLASQTLSLGLALSSTNLDSSLYYVELSSREFERLGIHRKHVYTLTTMASLLQAKGDVDKGLELAHRALAIAEGHDVNREIRTIAEVMSRLYESKGDHKSALKYYRSAYELYSQVHRSRNAFETGLAEAEHNYNKQKQQQEAEEAARRLLEEAKNERQRSLLIAVACVALLTTLFASIIFFSLRRTRRAKRLVEKQKLLVEQKQQEIIASINYTKHLQEAFLPSQAEFFERFSECFLVYRPKDIVAGDFYWMKHVEDTTFIATADCTGHGVPGALVSVVCATALERAVVEFGLRSPGAILDKTSELVLNFFERQGSEVHDGMDISLLAIKADRTAAQWSGANLPLLIHQPTSGGAAEMVLLKPDRQPVGRHHDRKPFQTTEIPCGRGTTFHFFTDGFADQFGGALEKKYLTRNLLKLINGLSELPMTDQGHAVQQAFDNWRNGLEQTDDVTVMGLRI